MSQHVLSAARPKGSPVARQTRMPDRPSSPKSAGFTLWDSAAAHSYLERVDVANEFVAHLRIVAGGFRTTTSSLMSSTDSRPLPSNSERDEALRLWRARELELAN